MVAAVQQQFKVGDRVKVAPVKGVNSHHWGKQGTVQSEKRGNGSITVQLEEGLRSFQITELELIESIESHETKTQSRTNRKISGNSARAARTGNDEDRKAGKRGLTNRTTLSVSPEGESSAVDGNEGQQAALVSDRGSPRQHIVCFSGGHSSALVAIAVAARYGKENVALLNHDINASKESADVKRFKQAVADYIDLPITYANAWDLPSENVPDQFDVMKIAKSLNPNKVQGFKVGNLAVGGSAGCSHYLKVLPFQQWMERNAVKGAATVYYGFDRSEQDRVIRRRKIIETMGYEFAAPLAEWSRELIPVTDTEAVGIVRPNAYERFKHANCIGCLKAGKRHWYVVFCTRPDVYEEAIAAEEWADPYTILPDGPLKSFVPLFEAMWSAGIEPTEHGLSNSRFWANVKQCIAPRLTGQACQPSLFMPCECTV